MTMPEASAAADAVRIEAAEDMDAVRALFVEYQRAIGVDLCFQGFDEELATLPGKYAPPRGTLLFACHGNDVAGCVGVRPLSDDTCEMKRLFVRPTYRGLGLGARLARSSIDAARRAGYARMRLDSLSTMTTAVSMYRRMGFVDIEPYYRNPLGDTIYLEKTL